MHGKVVKHSMPTFKCSAKKGALAASLFLLAAACTNPLLGTHVCYCCAITLHFCLPQLVSGYVKDQEAMLMEQQSSIKFDVPYF